MSFEYATLGGGCFWGMEYHLKRLPGILETEAGYCGGELQDPTYTQIKKGNTGHAEVVRVKFDPKLVSYETILDFFWRLHDPTQLNRQGVDVGTQYRSVIFYHSEVQKNKAIASKQKFDDSKVFPIPAVTEISPIANYYGAEDYHQDYFDRNGGQVCHALRAK